LLSVLTCFTFVFFNTDFPLSDDDCFFSSWG
jgi:hypothetical protein